MSLFTHALVLLNTSLFCWTQKKKNINKPNSFGSHLTCVIFSPYKVNGNWNCLVTNILQNTFRKIVYQSKEEEKKFFFCGNPGIYWLFLNGIVFLLLRLHWHLNISLCVRESPQLGWCCTLLNSDTSFMSFNWRPCLHPLRSLYISEHHLAANTVSWLSSPTFLVSRPNTSAR